MKRGRHGRFGENLVASICDQPTIRNAAVAAYFFTPLTMGFFMVASCQTPPPCAAPH
jgi:hypothetical protein